MIHDFITFLVNFICMSEDLLSFISSKLIEKTKKYLKSNNNKILLKTLF